MLVFLDIIEQPAYSKRAWCIFKSVQLSKMHHALMNRAAHDSMTILPSSAESFFKDSGGSKRNSGDKDFEAWHG